MAAPAAERTHPQIERLSHEGIQWIHIEEPSGLERAWNVSSAITSSMNGGTTTATPSTEGTSASWRTIRSSSSGVRG